MENCFLRRGGLSYKAKKRRSHLVEVRLLKPPHDTVCVFTTVRQHCYTGEQTLVLLYPLHVPKTRHSQTKEHYKIKVK